MQRKMKSYPITMIIKKYTWIFPRCKIGWIL